MNKEQEALELVKLLQRHAESAKDKKSAWPRTEDVAKSIGVEPAAMKAVLRRPRVLKLLNKTGLAVRYRGDNLYVYKQATLSSVPDPDNIPDDGDGNEEPKVVDEWGLDPNYYWYPPHTEDINIGVDSNMNIFLVGPAGSGKSSLLRKVFSNRGSEATVVSFHGEVSVDDIVGSKDLVPNPNGEGTITEFVEGFLPVCMRSGTPIIIDEADATPPDVQFVLHPVLMGEPLLLTKKGATYVPPEIGFLIAATGNTVGRGDDAGLYVGTNVLNEAYLDRYGMVVEHWYMPEQEEMKVLVKRTGLHKKIAQNLVDVAKLARDAMIADKLSSTFSTRKLLDWANLIVHDMDVGRAFVYTCINKVAREDKKTVAEFGQRVFAQQLNIDPNKFTGIVVP